MGNASQGMMLVGRSSKDIKGSAVGQFVFANRLAHGDDHGGDDEAGVHSNGDDEAQSPPWIASGKNQNSKYR